ncbi:LacI family DNA-binding transcriptional regulator [Vibrio maerlii]|uniref:LacI family DNA-binding transcriptional regulator n=1 Tax=Vibrio maerlii TaxID=2231648 RepID=UPI000E3BFD6E|nr:LacI family DNA-binding transcriptional regulator [Vibrio maerlii]
MTEKTLPTLQDVADKAGVSKAVASRAFSKEKKPISKDKKERVLNAAAELGYVINPFAQSLNSKTTGLVAVIVNSMDDISDLELFDQLIQGLQTIGKLPVFIRLKTEKDITSITNNAFVHRVDAAIIFSDLIQPQDMPDLFLTNKVINLNGQNWSNTWSVMLDEEGAIQSAVQYASKSGSTHAYLLAGRQSSAVEHKRIEFYQKHLQEQGVEIRAINFCDYKYSEAKQTLAKLGNDKFTRESAILCTSDAMAMAAIDYFIENQTDIPTIIGFDNTFFSHFGTYQFPSIGYSKVELINTVLELIELENSSDNLAGERHINNVFNLFEPEETS